MSFVCSSRCRGAARCANPQVAVTAKQRKQILQRTTRKSWLGISPACHSPRSEMERETICRIIGKGSRRSSIHHPPQSNYFLIRIQLLTRRKMLLLRHPVWFSIDSEHVRFPMRHGKLRLWRTHIRNACHKSRRHPAAWWTTFACFHVRVLIKNRTPINLNQPSHSITGGMA